MEESWQEKKVIRFIYYIYNYRLLYYLPMERMNEEEFINNVEGHITSLKNLDNKALKILVGKLEEENKKLKEENEYRKSIVDIIPEWEWNVAEETIKDLQDRIKELNEEIEEWKDTVKTQNEYNKFRIAENKNLKEELEWYKKQYQHSMWEDNWKLTKWGYASFNEYWELMEEDTLQELRDIGEI